RHAGVIIRCQTESVRRCSMAVATATLLGRPLWYELMTTDMKAAEGFYTTVVGWKTEPFGGVGQPYTAFNRSGDVAIGGMMTKPPEVKAPPFWAMYIGVPEVEGTVEKIQALGGRTDPGGITVPEKGPVQVSVGTPG